MCAITVYHMRTPLPMCAGVLNDAVPDYVPVEPIEPAQSGRYTGHAQALGDTDMNANIPFNFFILSVLSRLLVHVLALKLSRAL